MVKANPFGKYQDYLNLIPKHLRENPGVVVVGERSTPIVLEAESVSGMFGEETISYGLPYPMETTFNNIVLHIAPKDNISDMKEFSRFKQEVLNDEFPDYSNGRPLEIKDQTVIFPGSFYSEVIGSVSVSCSKYDVTIKGKDGTELSSTSFDENQEPYTKDSNINASVSVFVYPNSEIAEAVLDGTLKWHNLESGENGYLREELGEYEPSLGPSEKNLVQKVLSVVKI